MHLVIFDIDGTLTQTMKADEECFVRSFKEVFDFADIDTNWSHYSHTTDSGIFHDVFTARIGRTPTAQEGSRFRQHFIELIVAASSQSQFAQVAGLTDSCLGWYGTGRIGCRLLLKVGGILPASKWLAPGCVLMIIRRHQRMTHSTGSPL